MPCFLLIRQKCLTVTPAQLYSVLVAAFAVETEYPPANGVCITLDEAAFTSEIRTILSTVGGNFGQKVVGFLLVVDDQQFRTLVLSIDALVNEFGEQSTRSLYHRLVANGHQSVMLKVQRRMPKGDRRFPKRLRIQQPVADSHFG